MMDPTRNLSVTRLENRQQEETNDVLIQEQHVTILVDGKKALETACSPGNLRELAYGHLLSVGAIATSADIAAVEIGTDEAVVAVERTQETRSRSRSQQPEAVRGSCSVSVQHVLQAVRAVEEHGELFRLTGGTHVAAVVPSGSDGVFIEDISRTCAVEKALGTALLHGAACEQSLLVVTSRVPMQFVVKAAHAGIPIIAAVSAPTYQAVEAAEHLGICLCGFVREARLNVYSQRWRIGLP